LDCADDDCTDFTECNTNSDEICDNEIDDDGDGFIDCDDSDCSSTCIYLETCDNETDDDGDGFVDCEDQDCWNYEGCNTFNNLNNLNNVDVEQCNNNIDDDGDNLIDCEDPDCDISPLCEPQVEVCSDVVDNDNDGYISCLDDECYGFEGCGDCDPFTNNGCSPLQFCHIDKYDGFVPRCLNNPGNKRLNERCNAPDDCAPGLYCIDSGPNSVCLEACYPGVIENCTDSSTTCTPFTDWSYITDSTFYGLCW